MSYKQVKYYQELGDYEAAYKIARADWEANPSLEWPRKSAAENTPNTNNTAKTPRDFYSLSDGIIV